MPWIVGALGGVAAFAVAQQVNREAGLAVLFATGLLIAGLFIIGKPPPPKDNSGDPAAINFGR